MSEGGAGVSGTGGNGLVLSISNGGYGGSFIGGTHSADLHLAEVAEPTASSDGDLWTHGGKIKVHSNGQTFALGEGRPYPVCPTPVCPRPEYPVCPRPEYPVCPTPVCPRPECPVPVCRTLTVQSVREWEYDARSGLFGAAAALTFVLVACLVYWKWSHK